MLPVVLGGIALAAAGYGLKKYCLDEGCLGEDRPERISIDFSSFKNEYNNETPTSNIVAEFELLKLSTLKSSLQETHLALDEIKNLERIITLPIDNQDEEHGYSYLEPTDENKATLAEFFKILSRATEVQNGFLDDLDTVLLTSNDYTTFTQEEKELTEAVLFLDDALQKAYTIPLTLDNATISRIAKRTFWRLNVVGSKKVSE